jgi:hypothetical protein
MRRTAIVLVLCFISTAAMVTPVAARPINQPNLYTVDHLQADWVYPSKDGDGLRWYVIDAQVAINQRNGELVAGDAFGGVGWCSDDGTECNVRPKALEVIDYHSDVLLQTATLSLRGRGSYHRVQFFSTTRYSGVLETRVRACRNPYLWYWFAPRNASATGTVFGQTVDTDTEFEPEAESTLRSVAVCP